MTNFKRAFGLNLKLLRKSKSYTQEKLSELIDIHTRQLSKIETGEHFPSCRTLEKICTVLEITPRDLFNFDVDTEMLMTGTNAEPYYRVIKSGNIVYMQKGASGEQVAEKTEETTFNMLKVAKEIQKPVKVEYFEQGKPSQIVIYHSDGSIEPLNNADDKEYEKNVRYMLDKFKKYSRDKQYAEFIKLSLDSLENTASLEKLSIIIEGMKLARKK